MFEIIERDERKLSDRLEVRILVRDIESGVPVLSLIDMIYDSEGNLKHLYVNFEVAYTWYLRAVKFDYTYQREVVDFIKEYKPRLLDFIYWMFEDAININ